MQTGMLCTRRCPATAFTDARPANGGLGRRGCTTRCSAQQDGHCPQVVLVPLSLHCCSCACGILSHSCAVTSNYFGEYTDSLNARRRADAELHWQENKWVDALRKCALSVAAVAAVSAPLGFAPQEVLARAILAVCLGRSLCPHQLHCLTCMLDGQRAVWLARASFLRFLDAYPLSYAQPSSIRVSPAVHAASRRAADSRRPGEERKGAAALCASYRQQVRADYPGLAPDCAY